MFKMVIQRIHDAGLQLNDLKCHFNKSSLHFLDHTVSAQGVYPEEDHLTARLHAPVPNDAHQPRSLLGLLS